MPRRKKLPKIPDYMGVPTDENKLMVQKSNPLQTLSETEMTLPEFKILDAYLSLINSHDEEKRYVRFEKGELERILGVTKINKSDLHKRLKNLFQVVTIKDKHKKNGFTMIALFEKAEATQDENGLWQVDLACTPSAMEYIFNIDNIGYLRYRLKNIIELTSRYSYILYLYLENRRKGKLSKSWIVPLDELKEMLRCTADTYDQYKRFNDLILKKCYKELHEKTDLRFTYEPVKGKGRKVTAIHFTVETFADLLQLEPNKAISAEPEQSSLPSSSLENELSAYSEVCKNEFSVEQLQTLVNLMNFIDEKQRLSYFKYSYALLEEQANNSAKKIRNRFAYIKAIIKNDYTKFSKEKKQQTSCPNQKTYGGAYDLEAYENADPFADE